MNKNEFVALYTRLPAEKRTIVRARLREKGIDFASFPIVRRPGAGGAAPLSHAQQRLWFLDQLDPGNPMYNMALAVQLDGRLDAAALARSVDAIVGRHESLRTTFAPDPDGVPVQHIAGPAPLAWTTHDLSALPADAAQAQARTLIESAARAPFDLAAGPLLRVQLIRLADDSHVFGLVVHHIVSDGWSMGVLVHELVSLYRAFAGGEEDGLPALAIQYADYSNWQSEWLDGAVLERQLAFWRDQMAGAPALLSLPTDRPRPATPTHAGATHAFTLPAATVGAMRELANREQATLFMVAQALYAVLLARFAGQDDVCIGTPVANRRRDEVEPLIGFFVNTLVLRSRLDGNPRFVDLLRQVRATTLAAYDNQDVPFEQLVEVLQPQRDPSHTPLFQAVLALHNAPLGAVDLPGLRLALLESDRASAKFDLALDLTETGADIHASFEYATDLFDAPRIEQLAQSFVHLARTLVAEPDRRIGGVPLTDAAGQAALLAAVRGADRPHAAHATLHRLFERQAAATPDAIAVSAPGATLGYAALNGRANRLARRLRAAGVGPEAKVGLLMERSAELVTAVLAILKAGGAYVPIDPAYPAERMQWMLEDSQPVLVLTDRSLATRLAGTACPVLAVEDCALDEGGADDLDDLEDGARPGNLAYVIYTSGSTGKPKGALLEHGNVVRLFDATRPWFGFGPDDVWTLFHSIAFDFSVWELWGALLHGGRLVVVPHDVARAPDLFHALLAQERVTVLNQTPSAFYQLIEADGVSDAALALRFVVFGGEALNHAALAPWFARHGDTAPRLVNMYGITETTVHVTHLPLPAPGGFGSLVGAALPDLQALVLDDDMNPVPPGVPGELYVAGAGLARGYQNRAALTAERFVPHPFAATPGARLYRSGDLARWRPGHGLEYLGRIDQQVKLRGFRIELGEIEAALCARPGIQAASVQMVDDGAGGRRLVAYLVRAEDADDEALRAALAARLPDYMLPAQYVTLATLPLTPNGKVDRARLPVPAPARGPAERVAPRTPLEAELAEAWSAVLQLDEVGIHDNFFALGGHSLLATRLVARLRAGCAPGLQLRTLFDAPTVALLAARLAAPEAPARTEAPIVPVARTGRLPLSFAQKRFWFLDQLQADNALYNMPLALRLRGPLDAAMLRRVFDALVERHEPLRTVFVDADGVPQQVVLPAHPLAWRDADLSDLTGAAREGAIAARIAEEVGTPFVLASGPLVRVGLLRCAADEHVFLLTLHHILYDAWSLDVLLDEVRALYRAFASGAPQPLPPLPIQYADYTHWEHERFRDALLETYLDYWRARLAQAPELLALPTDRPRSAATTQRGARFEALLAPGLAGSIAALARAQAVTPFMVLSAALNVLLARHAGQDDVCIAALSANRPAGTERLIGIFMNILPLRTRIDPAQPFADLLAASARDLLRDYEHEMPFELILAHLAAQRDGGYLPYAQVALNFHPAPAGAPAAPSLGEGDAAVRMDGLHAGAVTHAHFDVKIELTPQDDALHVRYEYNADLFDAATIERLHRHYAVVLGQVCAAPQRAVGAIELLDARERQQVLVDWNATAAAFPPVPTLAHLFAEQVARTPDAPALVADEGRWTYRALNAAANRLARHLQDAGVGADILVGVCLERGAPMVVSLLAVAKAGGAYVPLDPAYPSDRLALLLADAAPALVLTTPALGERLGTVAQLDPNAFLDGADCPDPAPRARSSNLAYVIYTSGSTGRPKGVGVPHAGIVNRLQWMQAAYRLDAGDRVLQKTPYSFDVSVWEFFWPLAYGATLVVAAPGGHQDPQYLRELIDRERVTTLHFVPPMLDVFLTACGPDACPSLRRVMCSGEALPRALVERCLEQLPHVALHNLYGPTEASVDVSHWTCGSAPLAPVPIGVPIANMQMYVLDAVLQPVPPGVAGELYLAGVGLARGYLKRPGLTAQAFIPHPYAATPSARLYRTGDLARHLPDGSIEYLGRIDHQVKLRGLRIELGEIESALAALPAVREAVVLAREDVPGDRRLVAYVVPAAGETPRANGAADWSGVFDRMYADAARPDDPAFNIAGWISSFDGQPLPAAEMRAWVDHTVARIAALAPPRARVLEVGCGSGLLLHRLAPQCARYVGTDVSQVVLDQLAVALPGRYPDCAVELAALPADALGRYAGAGFDVVVINSVAQYFPDAAYLARVLALAVDALAPGGRIFVGDVRHLGRHAAFHSAVALARGADIAAASLRAQVRRALRADAELLVDPAFFHALRRDLPALRSVEVMPKLTRDANELTRFRYDVVLGTAPAVDAVAPGGDRWDDLADPLAHVRQLVTHAQPTVLALRDIPDARVARDFAVAAALAAAPAHESGADVLAAAQAADGVAPAVLEALAAELGYTVRFSLAGADPDRYHALLARTPVAVEWGAYYGSGHAFADLSHYTNAPGAGLAVLDIALDVLAPLAQQLPPYMVPAHVVELDALPLTPNGKLDRKALPAPDAGRGAAAFVAPRTDVERMLAAIWASVLRLDRVGAADHFFALGGHSLLATQVVARVRAQCGVELPLRAMFEAPVLEDLARRIEASGDVAPSNVLPPLRPVARDGALPLSFAQLRLWFLDQLEPGNAFYNVPVGVRLRGRLDVPALERTLAEVVRRHEVLRTRFVVRDPEPVQEIDAPAAFRLAVDDLSALPHAEALARAGWLAGAEAQAPFALARGGLLRARLLRIAPDDHVALITLHHIVSDGWSIGVLMQEVAASYTAFVQGLPAPLTPLPIQYADYAAWQRAWLGGPVLQAQLDYWLQALAGAPPLLALPTDRPRPAVQGHRGERLGFALTPETSRALDALARAHGATVFMVLAAGLNVLLARYAGQDDICIGTPVANRGRPELDGLIGFFVNTLVLRTRLDGNPSFAALLDQVKATALAAYAHQDVPFEQLVEALRPERQLGHAPVFQVMLALQNMPLGRLDLPGLALEPMAGTSATAKFDLTVNVMEGGDHLYGSFEFNTDLFDAATIERMIGHFCGVLDAVARDPGQRVATLPLLDAAQRGRMLVEWNATARPFPARQRVEALFDAQAARTPDRVAVSGASGSLTYAELARASNRLAHALRAAGVGPESLVGLCVERSPDMVVALLGILKAGGAYLPLDPAYPAERLAYMLADAAPVALVTQESLRAALPATDLPTVSLDGERARLAALPDTAPDTAGTSANLAYVVYTSGSTGRPKGVAITHEAIQRLVHDTDYVTVDGDAVVGQVANSAFDALTFEVWATLLHGARLHVVARDTLLVPERFAAGIRAAGIDTMFLTSAVFTRMAQQCPDAFAGMRQLLVGGEAPDPDAVRRVQRHGAPARLLNVYGPTECTTFALWHPIGALAGEAAAIPLGRPIANTRTYILDAHGEPVPMGVAGELHLAGAGLARGYLARPALTAGRFVPDPFGPPGERMYRTGDLARYLADGTIEYLGRIDDQVKLRGFRIEPGEIEARLRALPGVAQAAVLLRTDAARERCLVGYVVWQDGAAVLAPDAVQHALGAVLPDYMVPAHVLNVAALPLTANGKLDRQALPAPDGVRGASGYVAPATAAEQALAAAWAEVLRIDRVGATDHFFRLGGHSLLATQVVARLRTRLNVELPLRAVFEAPVLAALAQRIEALQGAASGQPPLVPVSRGAPLPLSFAQQRLWFLDQFESGSAFYNIPVAVRLRGTLDVAALAASFDEIVRRHEALRTRFALHAGEPVQVIDPFAPRALALEDLAALPHAEASARAAWLADDEARTPFDLAAGPLARIRLLRVASEEHVLLATLHHSIADGWSIGVLMRELAALYPAFAAGRPAPLAPLPIQYPDFAVWQRAWLAEGTLARQLAYWTAQLDGAPARISLPTDRPRPPVQSFRGEHAGFALEGAAVARLRALAEAQGATLFMVLAAAFNVLLARYAGQDDICVGIPVANRGRPELEGLIGFFVNTLVLRTRVRRDERFSDLLAQVKGTALAAYAHQDVPFEQVVEALRPERQMSHAPVFQVMLALQNMPLGAVELPGLAFEPAGAAGVTAKFDLTLNMFEDGDRLHGSFEYASDLFDHATVARMAAHWTHLLQAIADGRDQRVGALPLLGTDELESLVAAARGPALPVPAGVTLHGLVAAQAARTPDAVALRCGERTLGYAQLDVEAERLAARLRRLGLGPERLAGIALRRSERMIVALLAVLKTGAAYLPLDPDYPAARLEWMLTDAQPLLVLTDADAAARVPPSAATVLTLDRPDDPLSDSDGAGAVPAAPAADLAYVIYTSGSTGRPKGVLVRHEGACNMLAAIRAACGDAPVGRVLQFASLNFDASVLEIFLALTTGATLCLAERAQLLPGPDLVRTVREHAADFALLPPSALQAMTPAELAPLRVLLAGGEACSAALVDRYAPGRLLFNAYGPTEASCITTLYRTHAGAEGAPPLGHPLANLRLYVLDEDLTPVPRGVTGELFIAGMGLARGYLNRPALSAERFLPDPFGGAAGARMYRSGDLVRQLAGGAVEFVGRADQQVKLRGFRIELGEIEHVLARQPGVRAAVVLARDDLPGGAHLVAYAEGEGLDEGALRAGLQAQLPDYMQPAFLVCMDRLPLSANDKVDRKALPAPVPAPDRAGFVAPQTALEASVAGIWADVLGVEQVGVHDNFFDIGGHSLVATRVIGRIREQLRCEVSVRHLFEAPTVGQLAARLDRTAAPALPPLRPADRTQPLPLSFAQQRIWLLEQMGEAGAAFSMPLALRLTGALDHAALEDALQTVVARHEALRTAFVAVDGEPRMAVLPAVRIGVPLVDVAAHDVTALAQADADLPFDLTRAPLLRARLLRVGPEDHVLLVNLHHIVADGWSIGLLFEQWLTAYRALRAGESVTAAPAPLQYADYAAWQRTHADADLLRRQLDYWTAYLAGAPELLNLPTDRPRPPVQRFEGASAGAAVDAALRARLAALAAREGASMFMLLLSAFALLLARFSGETDIVIGTPYSNRRERVLEEMVGLFLGTLPLRADLSGQPRFVDLLARTRRTALDAYANSDVPFERIVDALPLQRDLSRNPLFQVFFNLVNLPARALEVPELAIEGLGGVQYDAKFDLTLYVQEDADGLQLHLVYNRGLFDAVRMEELLDQYRLLLEQVVAAPDAPVDSYSLLTARAAARLPDPALPLDAGWRGAVHTLFAAVAARQPDAPAVVAHDASWTYAELDRRSDQVASALQRAGVVRGDVVAVCAARNAGVTAAVFGVLKAGAVLMMLDPNYPAGHLQACLEAAPPAAWIQVSAAALDADKAALVAALPAVLPLHDEAAWAALEPLRGRAPAAVPVTADDVAVIGFTSGSTGKPKAVEGRHGPLTHFMPWVNAHFGLTPRDRFSMLSGLAHDPLQRDLFTSLCMGASVHVPHPDTVAAGVLAQWMAEQRITVAHLTPALAQVLADVAPDVRLPDLRRVFLVGDVLTRRDVQRLAQIAPGMQVVNYYGSTETQRSVSFYEIAGEDALQAQREVIPLGAGIPGVQLLVLGPDFRRAGIGEHGEVYVRSAHLARGYRGDPALSAERFLANPFAAGGADRLYRTGDLGRYLPNGMVECLGRADTQVKLRGFRIELGHIESLLGQHPQVREAIAMIRADAGGARQLAAWVVPQGEAPAPAALRAWLASRVPDYMIPASFQLLAALPLTPNGKVNRAALPAPAALAADADYAAPRTALEAALAGIWERVLRLPRVGVYDRFFDLGGHSLLAIRMMALVERELGRRLPLSALFSAPTVAGLAQLLAGGDPACRLLVPLRPAGAASPLFLVHPGGGQVFCYQALVAALDPAHPVHALQSAHAAGLTLEPYDRATVCAAYLAEIEAACPAGPLQLAGWSLGGTLALELARQLEARGRTVRFVALFDTAWQQGRTIERASLEAYVAALLDEPVEDIVAEHGEDARAPYLRLQEAGRARGAAYMARLMRDDPAALERDFGLTLPVQMLLWRDYETSTRNIVLASGFEPAVLDAPILAFWARATVDAGVATGAWRQFTRAPARGGEWTFGGHHRNFVYDANAVLIAGVLNDYLNEGSA